jgi:hypothetical protein
MDTVIKPSSNYLSSHLVFCVTSVRRGGRPDDSRIYSAPVAAPSNVVCDDFGGCKVGNSIIKAAVR